MFDSAFFASAPVVGFSGSRSPSPAVVSAVHLVCGFVPASSSVFVGCARGVDAIARSVFVGAPAGCRVFGVSGGGRGAFAARSVRFVRALAASGGVLASFPSGPCPAGVVPSSSSSRCFCGGGSGSWASLAFAVGLGVPCCVFLGSAPVPSGWPSGYRAGDWWVLRPAAAQLSLL